MNSVNMLEAKTHLWAEAVEGKSCYTRQRVLDHSKLFE
jgi:hypothetical protein